MLTAALILCLLLSFVLSGSESAVLAVSRVRVRHAAEKGDPRAQKLLPLLDDRDSLLGCITVANHLANLGAFLLVALPLIRHASFVKAALIFLIALPFFLLLLELMPKKLFRRYPFRSLRAVATLLQAVGLARPLFRMFAATNRITQTDDGAGSRRREDLKTLSESLAADHQLSSSATRLIGSVMDFHRRSTGDLMLPLDRSAALRADQPLHAALQIARSQKSALLPVLDEHGHFIGVLDTATLPSSLPADRLVRQHMRTLISVPARSPALHTLQRLRKQGRRLALVTGEDELPVGLITDDRLLAPLMQ